MVKGGWIIVGFLMLLGLSACGSLDWDAREAPEQIPKARFNTPVYSDAESVWRQARLALPVRGSTGSIITTNDPYLKIYNLTGTNPATRWPVLLAFSGCVPSISDQFMKAVAEQGFVVVQIDGRHRTAEPFMCDPDKSLHSRAAEDIRGRQATLSFALAALKNLTWVDGENIFILGAWEAGPAVAQLQAGSAKARIITEWDCGGAPSVYGLRDPQTLPTFAVTSAKVPSIGTNCASMFSGNPLSQNLSLPMVFPQDILIQPIVFTKLLQFLDLQLFHHN